MLQAARDPGVIRLQTLGGIAAEDAQGRPLEALLRQPRRLCLLVALAVESMHGSCTRERLMALFWPDRSAEDAATNLRQALAFLRRVLGDDLITTQGRHSLALAPGRLQCDLVDALNAAAAGRAPTGSQEPFAGLHLAEVGEAWADWLAEQRGRLGAISSTGEAKPNPDALPADPLARAAYLHGRFHWMRRPRESMKALACLEEAVRRAPDFAPAHAALADVYNTLGSWESGALPTSEAFPKARRAAQRALALDPCCAAAHTSLAYATAHFEWQWAESERQFERAIALDPGYAHAHHWRAHLLVAQGRFDEALAAGQRALELQPVDVIINVHMAWHHWLDRNADAAIEQAKRTEHLDDTDHWPPFFRGMACAMCGRGAEAVDALRDACARSRGNAVMRAGLGYTYAVNGDRRLARTVLRDLDPAPSDEKRHAYEAAVIHSALGDADAAFRALDDAQAARSGWLAYLAVDPRLDALRGDARYAELVTTLGLPRRSP